MATTKVGPKHQITIPKEVFDDLNLEVGDLLEAEVERGKIVLVPKRLTEKAPAARLTAREQNILMKAKKKIEKIRKEPIRSEGLTLEEAKIAAKTALIDKDQIWWWTEEWQKGEREAATELKAGKRVGPFTNAEELIASLHEGAKHLRAKA
ncbi:MAG: AbrB/MazE/SpoVT family DNA-binding domain-containing protein [Acidobacteria bacterium]|nr:AbrB/MazE/SpoVT family DNA-binding domain-containing protein [Acidobacteriota bacterium]